MEGLNQFNSTVIEEVTTSAKLAAPDPKQINELLECDLVYEMPDKMNLRDEKLEKLFIEKIIMKINNDFTGDSAAKKSAIKFLHDCFGDSIDEYNFIQWLSKKVNYKPIRLFFNLLKNCEKLAASKNVRPCDIHQKIYQCWLHPETSVVSTNQNIKVKIS